jgi:hypothetical protein
LGPLKIIKPSVQKTRPDDCAISCAAKYFLGEKLLT